MLLRRRGSRQPSTLRRRPVHFRYARKADNRSTGPDRHPGPAELQRLRTLRELLEEHELGLSDIAFALRLRQDAGLRGAVDGWLEATAERPEHVPVPDWLRWEQEKHSKLLEAAGAGQRPTTLMETR